jgi:hypothetical protein
MTFELFELGAGNLTIELSRQFPTFSVIKKEMFGIYLLRKSGADLKTSYDIQQQ